ncbi:MAG: CDP-archaeol synthase [Patescibacteria group bacterium]
MVAEIIKIIWFLLPAGLANMAPVLAKKVKFLDCPVDFGFKLSEQDFFGKNKTYRGFFFGILTSIIIIYIQKLVYPQMASYSIINYSEINIFLFGFILGFGALFGDLVKSFIKRRLRMDSGKPWIFFDQVDWVVGALIFMSIYIKFSWGFIILSILVGFILHIITKYIGYLLKIRKNII